MSRPKSSEVFIKVKELINQPGAWITGHVFDNDLGGTQIAASAPNARQFCAYGAVYKAQHLCGVGIPPDANHWNYWGFEGGSAETRILNKAFRAMPDRGNYHNAATYNNHHPDGLAAVNRLMCKAIEIALEEEERNETQS